MKKLVLLIISIISVKYSNAQYVDTIALCKSRPISYFISGAYGIGNGSWHSDMQNATLTDKTGYVIKSGDFKISSKTSTRYQELYVMFPVSDMMFGLGVNFEEHTMTKIDITQKAQKIGEIGDGEQVFDQRFRMDKFYALLEVPFYTNEKFGFSSAFQGRLGYFGYYGIDRESFFGEEQMAHAYYGSFGGIVTKKVYNRIYAYINPKIEYNYYNNKSANSHVTHHIYSFSAFAGIRIDVGEK